MGQRDGSAIASSTLAQASALFHIKENRTIACPSWSNLESSSNLPTQPNPQQPAGNSLQPHSRQFAASPVLVFQLSPPPKPSPDVELQAALRKELEVMKSTLDKLDQQVIRIAAFGLVSRGKSAVVNALLGQKILQTGPLNGVTQWPKSVRWTPSTEGKVQVELIDTPGLDEIQGEARAQMAFDVASQADLILFIVAGDITRTEYQALCELRQSQKPLILVFNKIDLYPDQDARAIYQQLQQLGTGSPKDRRLQKLLSEDEIVMVAAEPAPIEVRVEWPDGEVTYEWETPPPQVDELKQKILRMLNRKGDRF
jgi:small GTP-binding protein